MKKALIICAMVLALGGPGFAQGTASGSQSTPPSYPTVTVSAKGNDVRDVLADLFGQAKKSFVIQPNTHFALYLSLNKVDFDEALLIVCHAAGLKAELNDGIYYISKVAVTPPEPGTKPAPKTTAPAKPTSHPLPTSVLKKYVTTKLIKASIRSVIGSLSEQTEVPIEVDSKVPNYKLTAFLNHTSLKYALDEITGAAKLKYKFTDDGSILVYSPATEKKTPGDGVSMVSG